MAKRKSPPSDHDADPGIFLFVMTRTARHWRRELDEILAHYGLTEARTRPLIYIDRIGNGLRQKDLAQELEIEGSSLVRLLDSLERSGLIKRKVGKDDRRERRLYLTPQGREMVRHVRALTDNLHHYVLSKLSPTQEKVCLATFSILDKTLRNAANKIDRPKQKSRRRAAQPVQAQVP